MSFVLLSFGQTQYASSCIVKSYYLVLSFTIINNMPQFVECYICDICFER